MSRRKCCRTTTTCQPCLDGNHPPRIVLTDTGFPTGECDTNGCNYNGEWPLCFWSSFSGVPLNNDSGCFDEYWGLYPMVGQAALLDVYFDSVTSQYGLNLQQGGANVAWSNFPTSTSAYDCSTLEVSGAPDSDSACPSGAYALAADSSFPQIAWAPDSEYCTGTLPTGLVLTVSGLTGNLAPVNGNYLLENPIPAHSAFSYLSRQDGWNAGPFWPLLSGWPTALDPYVKQNSTWWFSTAYPPSGSAACTWGTLVLHLVKGNDGTWAAICVYTAFITPNCAGSAPFAGLGCICTQVIWWQIFDSEPACSDLTSLTLSNGTVINSGECSDAPQPDPPPVIVIQPLGSTNCIDMCAYCPGVDFYIPSLNAGGYAANNNTIPGDVCTYTGTAESNQSDGIHTRGEYSVSFTLSCGPDNNSWAFEITITGPGGCTSHYEHGFGGGGCPTFDDTVTPIDDGCGLGPIEVRIG